MKQNWHHVDIDISFTIDWIYLAYKSVELYGVLLKLNLNRMTLYTQLDSKVVVMSRKGLNILCRYKWLLL